MDGAATAAPVPRSRRASSTGVSRGSLSRASVTT